MVGEVLFCLSDRARLQLLAKHVCSSMGAVSKNQVRYFPYISRPESISMIALIAYAIHRTKFDFEGLPDIKPLNMSPRNTSKLSIANMSKAAIKLSPQIYQADQLEVQLLLPGLRIK
ncbi:hypothetical protein AGR6A_Cc80058 [Agrobacterium sp. NCPPB 925]|nr:hypothetical protein AGR6A_Cc80058 [Agrobacterium sp. NCPPB 925]